MQDASEHSINSCSRETIDQDRSESIPLYANVADTDTLKLIVAFFFGFSVTVTVALSVQLYHGTTELKPQGSVVSDNEMCSEVGAAILKQGGNAVDTAIAVAFCIGVVNPHVTGLGSGGYMLIYDQQERKVRDTIDFRVTKYRHDSVAGVPGFVAGMVLAHQLHGSLPWPNLLTSAEHIARNGYRVTPTFKASAWYLRTNEKWNQSLRELFETVQVDEMIANRDLAATLSHLANADPMDFYRNKSMLLEDLWYIEDVDKIRDYKAIRGSSMKGSFLHYDIIVPGKGSGGPFLLENLQKVNLSLSPLISAVDAFKLVAEGWPDSSAAHISVMDGNDLYVSVVSGLGTVLGSQMLTKSGYIMNNMMEITHDVQKDRPDGLLTPVIALENGKVCGKRLLLGAGDVRDVAQVLVYLLRNSSTDIVDSIEAPRVRIQTPVIQLEHNRISKEDLSTLKKMDVHIQPPIAELLLYPSINVIEKITDTMTAHADSRGAGYYVVF